jgi:hypothetical protein
MRYLLVSFEKMDAFGNKRIRVPFSSILLRGEEIIPPSGLGKTDTKLGRVYT